MTDQMVTTMVAAGVPTLAVVATFIRNEFALSALCSDMNARFIDLSNRVESINTSLSTRMDLLDRELRQWARIVMKHNTDIARLKDKTGLADQGE